MALFTSYRGSRPTPRILLVARFPLSTRISADSAKIRA
jgi:hypothetical protein